MSSMRPLTVTSLEDRRAQRRSERPFEEQAMSLVETHVSRLDVHRRSVLLFYLLFGLLAGFFLGIAGAKGVLASTLDTQQITWSKHDPQTRLNPGLPAGLTGKWPLRADSLALEQHSSTLDHLMGSNVSVCSNVALEAEHPPLIRYAGILRASSIYTYAGLGVEPQGAGLSAAIPAPNRHWYVGLLTVILAVAASLTFVFWRHLSHAYVPRRKLQVEWGPRRPPPASISH